MRTRRISHVAFVLLSMLAACRDNLAPPATGAIALEIRFAEANPVVSVIGWSDQTGGPVAQSQSAAAGLDSARARAQGPTNKTVSLRLVGGFWEGALDGLVPGSYCVSVEGFVGNCRDRAGESCGVQVVAGQTAQASVTVPQVPVASVSVTPTADTIFVGETTQLTATLRDASSNVCTGRVVTWSSSDNTIATVSQTGLVTGRACRAQPATISATSMGSPAGTASITVLSTVLPITPGQTISGALSNTDCPFPDGSYFDLYQLILNAGTRVQIDMTSSSFDAYLVLFNAQIAVIAQDDDSGGGLNARIVQTLAAGTYYIAANSAAASSFGPYQLSVVQSP